jgi:hypothetical protein
MVLLGIFVSLAAGCAGSVSPNLPPIPQVPCSQEAGLWILVTANEESNTLAAEVGKLLEPRGSLKQYPPSSDRTLREFCGEGVDLVLQPSLARAGFASNAAERNTLFIYESAVIVGLPVTLISAYAWPWMGEFVAEGELATFWCTAQEEPTLTRVIASVREEGHGIIAQDTLREMLEPYVMTSLARQLIEAAARCGRLEKGRERCPEDLL